MILNENSNGDEDEDLKIKQRIAIYAPIKINDELKKLAKKKKISKNKLALEIITTFITSNKNVVI